MSNDPIKLVEGIQASLKEYRNEDVKFKEAIQASVNANGEEVKKAVEVATEAAAKMQGIALNITEIEQKLAEKVQAGQAAPRTLGQVVSQSDAVKAFHAGKISKARIEANTITGTTSSPDVNSDTLVPTQRRPGIVPLAFRVLRLTDIVPVVPVSSNIYEYTQESTNTNGAAETQEGNLKPESAITYTLTQAPIRTIATWLKASKQVLADAPQLEAIINNRLAYYVDLKMETQLIAGDGSGNNISGILDSGNYTAFTPATGDTALDSVNRAIQTMRAADYEPSAVLMHPTDWHGIERLKDSQNRYIVGDPLGVINRVLWGLPVVVTPSMTSGTFCVADFTRAYEIALREGTTVELSDQDGDNFRQNLVTILAEKRGALATLRSAASYAGSLTL